MQQDLEIIAGRLDRFVARLKPMQVAGGSLTALEMRRLVGELDRSVVEIRATGRRVGELLRIIVEHGAEEPAPPPRPALRVVAPRNDGPEAA